MLLVFFYSGVLELSKSFLDPFGNAGSLAQNIDTEVRHVYDTHTYEGPLAPPPQKPQQRPPARSSTTTYRYLYIRYPAPSQVLITEMNMGLPRWSETSAEVP